MRHLWLLMILAAACHREEAKVDVGTRSTPSTTRSGATRSRTPFAARSTSSKGTSPRRAATPRRPSRASPRSRAQFSLLDAEAALGDNTAVLSTLRDLAELHQTMSAAAIAKLPHYAAFAASPEWKTWADKHP
jgi:hypothetical protein